MRKLSGGSWLNSVLIRHFSLRAFSAAFSSARPFSTGPAKALDAKKLAAQKKATPIASQRGVRLRKFRPPFRKSWTPNVCLFRNSTPPSSRQIKINDGATRQSGTQQREPRRSFMQQQLACTEQHAINQNAARRPIHQIHPTIVHARNFRYKFGDRPPTRCH